MSGEIPDGKCPGRKIRGKPPGRKVRGGGKIAKTHN